jgi:hypothetical protein
MTEGTFRRRGGQYHFTASNAAHAMATIDDLISGLQLSDEDKRQARAMGLMQLGFGLLGSRGPTLYAVGQAGNQALQGYRGAIEDTRREKCGGMNSFG